MELLMGDCYRLATISTPIRTVLDIGANVGTFCIAARDAFPEATIHAYEPNRDLEEFLQVQTTAANARYFLEAVAKENGRVRLDKAEDSVCSTTAPDKEGSIPAVSLREAVRRLDGTVGLAKVDCEGAEWDLFQDHEIWQSIQNVTMEYHLTDQHTHAEARRIVEGLGFEVTYQKPAETFGLLCGSRRHFSGNQCV